MEAAYSDTSGEYAGLLRYHAVRDEQGIFLNENDLPQDPILRDKVILSIFGSPDPRQIDGLGGAEMLTSKLGLVSATNRTDADVDFSFGQVEIDKPEIFYDGLCGNISSGVGTYAVEEGLVKAVEPVTKVRVYSRNTDQIYITEVPVKDGRPLVTGDYEIAGVPERARRSRWTWRGPSGQERAGSCRRETLWISWTSRASARWTSRCWTL